MTGFRILFRDGNGEDVYSHSSQFLMLYHVVSAKVVYFQGKLPSLHSSLGSILFPAVRSFAAKRSSTVPASIGLYLRSPVRESEIPALGRGRIEGRKISKIVTL